MRTYFRGLDTLRFWAAMAVVVGHAPMTLASLGHGHPTPLALFYRGAPAVSFFFTLSGFLITYLLLEEHRVSGAISVRRFYLRRVLRIWPLYFAVVVFGLLFYNALLPALGIPYEVRYELPTAIALYALFLPNLMNSLYAVGGILNPLWSIGIEEQFYLTWAPLVRRFRAALPVLCWTVVAAFFGLSLACHGELFGNAGWLPMFLGQLEFHFMATGALWAWALHTHRDRVLASLPFSSRALQWLLVAVLVDYCFFDFLPSGPVAEEVLQMALYGWLVVNVAANPRNVLRLANPATEYLGRISYGIYMLHMPAVYAAAKLFLATGLLDGSRPAALIGFYVVVIALTFGLASLSYHAFERRFLQWKERLGRPAPAAEEARAAPALLVDLR